MNTLLILKIIICYIHIYLTHLLVYVVRLFVKQQVAVCLSLFVVHILRSIFMNCATSSRSIIVTLSSFGNTKHYNIVSSSNSLLVKGLRNYKNIQIQIALICVETSNSAYKISCFCLSLAMVDPVPRNI